MRRRREPGRAETAEKRKCLVIAAEQRVLPVVNPFAGLAIGKRGRPAAEPRPLFDDHHPAAGIGQADGGAQPGPAGADDDDVRGHRRSGTRRDSAEPEPPPGARGDQSLLRTAEADHTREDVEIRGFNPGQDSSVDAAHDLGREEPPRVVFGNSRIAREKNTFARAA